MRRDRRCKPSVLRSFWRRYTDFQRGQLAHSTIERDYRKVARVLERLPGYLDTSIEIRDWLLQRYSSESTRRFLMQFSACCKWAIDSDLATNNPFEGLTRQFRRKVNTTDWTGFTATERDTIISTFERECPHYADWVKFLFWTGCRPEEAAALRWQHISPDLTKIRFAEALPSDTKRSQATKTWKSRTFPANERLQSLLRSIRPPNPSPTTLLFSGVKGHAVEYHNFQTRQWKPIVTRLVEEGKLSIYLPQSHCRHTFITLALEHLSVKDVAYLVGNSPDIIYKHYASRSRDLTVPEF